MYLKLILSLEYENYFSILFKNNIKFVSDFISNFEFIYLYFRDLT